MPPRETAFDFADAADLLRRCSPELEALFGRYSVDPAEADRILSETLVILGVRRSHVGNPEAWLLDTVKGRCEQWIERRLQAATGPEN